MHPITIKNLKALKTINTMKNTRGHQLVNGVYLYIYIYIYILYINFDRLFMMKITSLQNILKLQLSKWQRQCFGSAGIDANTPHILHKILFVSMFRRFLFLYVPQLHCSMKQTSDMPHPCIPACIPSRRVPDSTRMFHLTTLHNAYYECV